MVASVLALAGPATASPTYSYEGAATTVTQANGTTVVDNGAVVCTLGGNSGGGGFCIPFADMGSNTTLTVTDDASGTNVSYQVCLDNNGNGACGDGSGTCTDQILFSHATGASPAYHNPMSGLPTGSPAGCPGPRGFKGLVVFVCQGTHDTHPETATSGTATLSSSGGLAGFTEPGPPEPFCGGPLIPQKRYVVTHNSTSQAFTDFGSFSGTASVSPPLTLPGTTPVTGTWSLNVNVTTLLSGTIPMSASGLLGPVAGIGAACGISQGYNGSGTLGSYTLSEIGWESSAGGTIPVTGAWENSGQKGALSALVEAFGGDRCLSGATSFTVVGSLAL